MAKIVWPTGFGVQRIGNKALEQFASKFGPRSLDEELEDADGYRLIDNIVDERSSSWLGGARE